MKMGEANRVVRLGQADELPSFVLGQVYDRWPKINDKFGGNRQSGISDSTRSPAIFVFSGDSGERYGYQDHFDEDGTFFYTGEGQIGDMTFTRGNQAIRDHSSNGKALHIFRTLGKAKGQKYLGEFAYADHEFADAKDVEGNARRAIIFRLVPVGRLERDEHVVDNDLNRALSLEESRRRAIEAAKSDGSDESRQGTRTIYSRSQAVRNYVLIRAGGICELCALPSPFQRADGSPYMEPHHTTRVSDGGPDHPRFVAALCPACHREVHFGEHAVAKNAELCRRLLEIEPAR